ncbi:hypothetical protein ACFL0U_01870 [Pseudomonadota bacterium]
MEAEIDFPDGQECVWIRDSIGRLVRVIIPDGTHETHKQEEEFQRIIQDYDFEKSWGDFCRGRIDTKDEVRKNSFFLNVVARILLNFPWVKEKSEKIIRRLLEDQSQTQEQTQKGSSISRVFFRLNSRATFLVIIRVIKVLQKEERRVAKKTKSRALIHIVRLIETANGRSTVTSCVTRRNKIRVDYLPGLGKYKDILAIINHFKKSYSLKDSHFAIWVKMNMMGKDLEEDDVFLNLQLDDRIKIKSFICKLSQLLMGCEPDRSPSSFIVNQMLFDLIGEGEVSWRQVLVDARDFGFYGSGLMPMSGVGSTRIATKISSYINEFMPYPYNYNTYPEDLIGDEHQITEQEREIMEKESRIFKEWQKLKHATKIFGDFGITHRNVRAFLTRGVSVIAVSTPDRLRQTPACRRYQKRKFIKEDDDNQRKKFKRREGIKKRLIFPDTPVTVKSEDFIPTPLAVRELC